MNPDIENMQSHRKRETKPCAQCGKSITKIKIAKYCDNRCKQIAKRARAAT